MKSRVVITTIMIVGLWVAFPVASMAQTIRTVVSGVADFADGIAPAEDGFLQWQDSGGRTHFNNLVAQGNFTLMGEGMNIVAKWVAVFNILITDAQGNGRVQGPLTVTTTVDGEEEAIWEGHYVGEGTNRLFSGTAWALGRGPFEGKILEFTWDEDDGAMTAENPSPDIFILNGAITEPPPQ